MIHKLLGMVLASTLLVSVVETPPAQAATWYKKTSCDHVTVESEITHQDYFTFNGCITFEYTTVPAPLPYRVRYVSARFWGTVTGAGSLFGWRYTKSALQVITFRGQTLGAQWVSKKGIGTFTNEIIKIGSHVRQVWVQLTCYGGGAVISNVGLY